MPASVWKQRATGSSGGMVADADEVRRALRLFADHNAGCELVGLTVGKGVCLIGADVDGLAAAAAAMPDGIGVYFRFNPVPVGLDRQANNGDVLRRRWLYIDADPLKAAGHEDDPATDSEKDGARRAMEAVNEWLMEQHNFPAPVITDSGNGFALLYRIDLPNDELSKALVKRLLYTLAERFKGEPGRIDKSVHNANRLVKLPGTWAKKGKCSDDRPYRVCRLVYVPAELECVTPEQLAAAAGTAETNGKYEAPPKAEKKDPFKLRAGETPTKAWARAALDRECARVALSRPGERNDSLNRAAFSLGQLVPGGFLNQQEVEARLAEAAKGVGLEDAEIARTIRSGITAGMKEPRGPKAKPDPAAQPETPAADKAPAGESIIVWASSITPRAVEWLWPGRIPLGKLTTFAGVGGLGKTFVLCDITARVTRGLEWPDGKGECAERGRVLFISGEDEPDDTLVPRMIEMGADLSRVAFLRTEVQDAFTMADVKTLEKALEHMGGEVRFVAIDPPTAYLGGVNDHKNAELRQLLTPLKSFAAKYRLSLTFNTHVNKPQGAKVEAMMRVMGSVAWVNAVRAAHMFARDPNDPERRLFCGMKNNLGPELKGLAYRLKIDGALAKVEWLGEVDTTADEAMNKETGKKKRSVVASEWLADLFAEVDKLPSTTIFKRQDAETTLSKNALKEAKEEMGIRARRECDDEGDAQWFWYWPKEAREAWKRKTDRADDDIPDDPAFRP